MKWNHYTIKWIFPFINKFITHFDKKINKFKAVKNAKWRIKLIKGILECYKSWGVIL